MFRTCFFCLFIFSVRSCLSQNILETAKITDGDFTDIHVQSGQTEERSGASSNKSSEEEEETKQAAFPIENEIYSCPIEGCICSFKLYYNMENHILYGKCKFVTERRTLLDKAKLKYREKLEDGTSQLPSLTTPSQSSESSSVESSPKGWALRTSKKGGRFNCNQRQYLDEKFQLGQQTGHKADPEQVSVDMRRAKNLDGTRKFTVDEYLSAQQIKAYFSRTNAKLRNIQSDADLQAVTEQEQFINTRQAVLAECQITHPITYDTYNICELHKTGKLRRFNVAMLRLMCEYFGIGVDHLSGTRFKAPYLELLKQLVGACSCETNH